MTRLNWGRVNEENKIRRSILLDSAPKRNKRKRRRRAKISKSSNTPNSDRRPLHRRSELYNLGYQIGFDRRVSREDRWRILVKVAIPKLGLERVVNHIEWLVRERKAQRDGGEKYRYAISEWEHDLNCLKALPPEASRPRGTHAGWEQCPYCEGNVSERKFQQHILEKCPRVQERLAQLTQHT